MIEDLHIRQYSASTVRNYVASVAEFALHFGRSPELLGPEEIREYQRHLVEERHAAYATLCMKVAALRFVYNVTLGKKLDMQVIPYPRRMRTQPEVLSPQEVSRLLTAVGCLKHRAALMTAYGGGLRVSEVLSLQPSDIDSERMVMRVRQGKGRQDRLVMLPERLLQTLREYWMAERGTGRPSPWLFPSPVDPSRPLSAKTLERAIRRAARSSTPSVPSAAHARCCATCKGRDRTSRKPPSRESRFDNRRRCSTSTFSLSLTPASTSHSASR
jgi:integrase